MIPIQKGAAPIELELKIKEVKATPDTTLNWPNVSGTLRLADGTEKSVVDAVKQALL
ncbi:hypothetical protein [Thermophilibacter sp.]|uniref:hypothetical protein n=1 Tax=Thermophilibacter sp. TaxID=2847309 RepID=UPI003A8E5574